MVVMASWRRRVFNFRACTIFYIVLEWLSTFLKYSYIYIYSFFLRCQNDPTLGFFPLNSSSFGYRYQTFKFVNFDQVFLHCKAFVCLLSEKDAECDRSCNSTTTATTTASGRRRRAAISRPTYSKQIYHISGPAMSFYRKDTDNTIIRQWNITAGKHTIICCGFAIGPMKLCHFTWSTVHIFGWVFSFISLK